MATRTETNVVYAAGVVQGIALVTFPAASTILTDPAEYDLSSTQYGSLFLPQVITAIAAALLGASLGEPLRHEARLPGRPRGGLVSMVVLIVSQFLDGRQGASPTGCCWLPRRSWAPASASPYPR